jgi:hypothetical protein
LAAWCCAGSCETASGVLPFHWGGLYAGLNLGGGFGDVGGIIFGGQIG